MTNSTKIAFAAFAVLMGFAALPANAGGAVECSAWRPVLGGACKTRKCTVGVSPAIRVEHETVCPHATIPPRRAPIVAPDLLPGPQGTTAPQ